MDPFRFKLRRGTTAQWLAADPVLLPGEPGIELDTGKMKIGNGTHNWTELPYFLNQVQIQAIIDELNAEGVPGPQGPPGPAGTNGTNGTNGLSAYQVAVANGFVGNEAAWLLSLKGATGDAGADGDDGTNGLDGLDAYQIAVANGFVGTQAEWLLSLKGAKGDAGDIGPEGPEGPQGADGADYTGPTITASATEPLLPVVGDVWIDTSA